VNKYDVDALDALEIPRSGIELHFGWGLSYLSPKLTGARQIMAGEGKLVDLKACPFHAIYPQALCPKSLGSNFSVPKLPSVGRSFNGFSGRLLRNAHERYRSSSARCMEVKDMFKLESKHISDRPEDDLYLRGVVNWVVAGGCPDHNGAGDFRA
jgi:hypothetical protein